MHGILKKEKKVKNSNAHKNKNKNKNKKHFTIGITHKQIVQLNQQLMKNRMISCKVAQTPHGKSQNFSFCFQ